MTQWPSNSRRHRRADGTPWREGLGRSWGQIQRAGRDTLAKGRPPRCPAHAGTEMRLLEEGGFRCPIEVCPNVSGRARNNDEDAEFS